MKYSIHTFLQSKYFYAFVAFLLWGSWAYLVNVGNNHSGLTSGLSQGIASFVITVAMIESVTYFYNRFNGKILKLFLPSLITISLNCIFLIVVHYYAGTPHTFKTILPALTVGYMFCLFTTYSLYKSNQHREIQND